MTLALGSNAGSQGTALNLADEDFQSTPTRPPSKLNTADAAGCCKRERERAIECVGEPFAG